MQNIKIDRTLYTSKPSESNRAKKEMETYDLLEKLGIPFLRIDHEETPSIEACNEVEELLGIEICKNLFLSNSSKSSYYLMIMPGRKKFRTKDVSRQINSSRLSFAEAEDMANYLNVIPGSVSIMGLMNDENQCVKLLMDKEVLKAEFIGCHPCVNTSSIKIKTSDLLTKFLPYTGHGPTFVEL